MGDRLESAIHQAELNHRVFVLSATATLSLYAGAEHESDPAQEQWQKIVRLAMNAGMTAEDIEREIGASHDVQRRWLHEDVRPRFAARTCMARAMGAFLIEKHGLNRQPS